MPQELIQLNVRRPAAHAFLILLLVAATVWAYFVARWYLGNTLAEYFNTTENSVDLARFAASLAPNDPLTHWRLGQVYQVKLPPDQQSQVVAEYEKAVSLSPNDYRFWMALGTAQEQLGDIGKGEQALRQAVALAPSYSYPRWYLGNLLLRSGRYEEAFAELRLASQADPTLQPQLFSLVLEIHGKDIRSLKQAVGEAPAANAAFAVHLLGLQRFEDGLFVWNSLSEADKKANRSSGDSIVTTLVDAKRFHDASNVWNSLAPGPSYQSAIGRLVDGSFEEGVSRGQETVFGWQVKAVPQMQIGIDPESGHSGVRSLRLLFEVKTKLDTINASQLVPVAPLTEYDFECYVKTEKLQGGRTPFIEITDATDGSALATSEAAPNGDNDWGRLALSFKTGAKTEAVRVRVVRTQCGEDEPCPIFGVVWYDDFSFKRRD